MPLSTFLDGRVPTRLRGIRWLALSDTGNVLSAASTSDTGGGVTQVWSAGGTVVCRIDPLSGREGVTAGKISDQATHLVTVPPGTVVSTNNRFAITGRGTFDIHAVRDRTANGWAKFLEVTETA